MLLHLWLEAESRTYTQAARTAPSLNCTISDVASISAGMVISLANLGVGQHSPWYHFASSFQDIKGDVIQESRRQDKR